MAKTKRMSAEELASTVDGLITDAGAYDSSDRAKHREWALRYYEGEVDFPEMGVGRSKYVSRDVADTHGLIMPGLKRIFFSSDRLAIYEPTREEHEAYADEATDLVNYVLMKECNGYRQISDAMSDAVLIGNGLIKHWWDKAAVYRTDEYSKISTDQYKLMIDQLQKNQDGDLEDEELEHEEYDDPDFEAPTAEEVVASVPDLMPALQAGDPSAREFIESQINAAAPVLHDFKIKRLVSKGKLTIMALPNEEFLVDRVAKVLDETARFAAHKYKATRSDLIRQGYDKTKVNDAPRSEMDVGEMDRRAKDDRTVSIDKAPDKSTELIDVYECYVLVDYDGDGIAERRKIVMAGRNANKRTILENEEWGDDLPFTDLVPDPRPHAWRGRGIYEDGKDVQDIKTVGMRGVLDNTYQQLVPQREVEADAYENMDAVFNPTFGSVLIRRSSKPPMAIVQNDYIADKVFPLVQYMDEVMEKRTGVSQRSQAMDIDALMNQSATAVNAAQSAAASRTTEYAQNIADGIRRLYQRCLRLITKNQDRAKTIRLRGKLTAIDPSGWNADMDVSVNTGLGTGSRDRDLAMLQGIASKQEMLLQQFGPFNEDLNIGHLMETYQKMAEASGIRNAESFFPSIEPERVAELREQSKPKGDQPNPQMMAMQAQMEIEKEKASARLQLDQAKAEAQMALQRQKQESELALERDKAAMQLQFKRELQEAQLAARERESALSFQLKQRELEMEAQLTREANFMRSTPDLNIQEQTLGQ